ncbi:MAG TPA: TspO/MBR family protein [Gemmatimonadales bacterium]|nr:TspO/MBR family protein [Gemmatimonadales bacterium]
MSKTRDVAGLAGWVIVAFTAAAIGSQFMPDVWYESLAKPSWNPPNSVFGPVWTVLYTMMGTAAWLVWRRGGFRGGSVALVLFGSQLVLNAAWSYLFFGAHYIGYALLDIVALLVLIVMLIWRFGRIDRRAGWLMVPYAAWVAFATALNASIWQLNR